jgi:DNA-binding NarL/FixJ family response regulator
MSSNFSPPIRVSITDDDGPTRALVADWLNCTPGVDFVGGWGDAETTLEQLPVLSPDVALVDVQLRTSNGIALIRRLKPVLPATQFVILTVCKDSEHIHDALVAGATGYLLKSTPQDELVAGIREVHDGGSPMSSEVARKILQFFMEPSPHCSHAEKLSAREDELLRLISQGLYFKEVAGRLQITVNTVKTHVRRIYEKLQVCSRTQAVAKYSELKASHRGRDND